MEMKTWRRSSGVEGVEAGGSGRCRSRQGLAREVVVAAAVGFVAAVVRPATVLLADGVLHNDVAVAVAAAAAAAAAVVPAAVVYRGRKLLLSRLPPRLPPPAPRPPPLPPPPLLLLPPSRAERRPRHIGNLLDTVQPAWR